MAERIALLYHLGSAVVRVDSLSRMLTPAGLRLTHPSSGRVVLIDDDGEQIEVAPEELQMKLLKEERVAFQWWRAKDHSVYCLVRQEGDITIIALGMEGCNASELQAIGAVLQDRFISGGATSVGLVFDPQGATEDYDWDRFFIRKESLYGSTISDLRPEVMGVTKADLGRMTDLLGDAAVVDHGPLVIVRW